MIKGIAGKLSWMESFKNPLSKDIDAFDLAEVDGEEGNLSNEQSMLFQDVLHEAA